MKRPSIRRTGTAIAFAVFVGATGWMAVAAAGDEGPPRNAPSAETSELPSARQVRAALAGGQSEIYTGIKPCRILDTRPGTPMVDATRSFKVSGALASQGGLDTCGIPTYATSVAVNLTGIAVGGGGFIRGWAFNDPPPTATLLNVAPAINASNQVNIPVCRGVGCTSAFTLRAFGGADVIGDAVGYYTQPLYASVKATGGFYSGIQSGAVSAVRNSVGRYTVTFVRPVNKCDAQATDTYFTTATDVSVDQTYGSASTVTVEVRNTSGVLVDTFFNIHVTC